MIGYENDAAIREAWQSLNPELRQRFQRGFEREMKPLGAVQAQDLTTLNHLLQDIQSREAPHREALEQQVHAIVKEEYGAFVQKQLYLRLGEKEIPEEDVAQPGLPDIHHAPLETDTLRFYKVRRELYNMLSQGTGWKAMHRFVQDQKGDLQKLDPELPACYRQLHDLALRTQIAGFGMIDHFPMELLEANREAMRAGREIVMVGFSQSHDGFEDRIGLADVRGIAVGLNAWALVHEAMKAGYEMRTALEASQRSILSADERSALDAATGSALAEIRQQMYGQIWQTHLHTFLQAVITFAGKPFTIQTYFDAVELVFACFDAGAFHHFINHLTHWHSIPESQRSPYLKSILSFYVEYEIV
jgi:hypothetical protein